jgi:DNA repair protein RecN (Recombination protein N)
MLKEIRVRNYAIIDDISLVFHPGLNILTGETGAGKSIIVGALGILLGQRAYSDMIKTGRDEAVAEAYFEINGHPLLDTLGIKSREGIIIRRHISSSGRTRSYINDSMVNLQSLTELGNTLVDMHGQHDHQSLLSTDNQLRVLDHYGGVLPERAGVAAMYAETAAIRAQLEDIRLNTRQRAQKLDMLQFQAGEIDSAALTMGEDLKLEEERQILSNLSRLNELVESSYNALYSSEGSCTEKLSAAVSDLQDMASIDPGVSDVLAVLNQARPLIEDASFSIRDLRDRYDMDPERLDELEDRLDLIGRLKRKYGDSIEAVLKFREDIRHEIEAITTSEETEGDLDRKLNEKEEGLQRLALGLSEKRRKAAKRLDRETREALGELALEKAEFTVGLKPSPVTSSGIDEAEFLFSANRGEDPRPLRKVASGGELSRIMLALKSVMRNADEIPVLIFDEVDAGIGGETALNVARKLKDISGKRQVICITHLPQIASLADSHFLIEKGVKDNKVFVDVRELSDSSRQEEIARMLGGSVTETSMEHAREILGRNG